ncbi:Hpt domain-containing protein [Marinicauda algicola]|uniref:Hpt domain-containing protein n=1 Tax=Marinicauda algicola TaxID=2029849 RepID=A0A4S2GWW9_9PROT|nr:Hpt domain-containing protein [Marinicauda algicola]TGY87242.1 Hpt domain-containing protein [Marinicauda algicola]
MSRPPVLDLDHLARYTAADEALEAELFALFTSQTENCLARMMETGDGEAFKAAVHTLKGAARGIGAFALGEACAQAEARPLEPEAIGHIRDCARETLARIGQVLAERPR